MERNNFIKTAGIRIDNARRDASIEFAKKVKSLADVIYSSDSTDVVKDVANFFSHENIRDVSFSWFGGKEVLDIASVRALCALTYNYVRKPNLEFLFEDDNRYAANDVILSEETIRVCRAIWTENATLYATQRSLLNKIIEICDTDEARNALSNFVLGCTYDDDNALVAAVLKAVSVAFPRGNGRDYHDDVTSRHFACADEDDFDTYTFLATAAMCLMNENAAQGLTSQIESILKKAKMTKMPISLAFDVYYMCLARSMYHWMVCVDTVEMPTQPTQVQTPKEVKSEYVDLLN